MQYDLIICITKIYIVKYHIALNLYIIGCSICLMSVFPCPMSGTFVCRYQFSILFFCIYQCHIAVIYLWLFIQQLEDTLCSRKCHNDRI